MICAYRALVSGGPCWSRCAREVDSLGDSEKGMRGQFEGHYRIDSSNGVSDLMVRIRQAACCATSAIAGKAVRSMPRPPSPRTAWSRRRVRTKSRVEHTHLRQSHVQQFRAAIETQALCRLRSLGRRSPRHILEQRESEARSMMNQESDFWLLACSSQHTPMCLQRARAIPSKTRLRRP